MNKQDDHSKQIPWRWMLLTFLVAVLVYAGTLGQGFIFDDVPAIVNNSFIRSLDRVPDIFLHSNWAGSGRENWLYRPLTVLTFALNHAVSGYEPWSYHLANVFLHGTVSGLVLLLGLSWGLPLVAAVFGGLVFALHPIHVEVVANVVGRNDSLAAFFILAMMLLHPWAAKSVAGKDSWRWLAPTGAFFLAMLSKETGAVGIGLVVLSDWLLPGRKKKWPLYGTYAATLGVFLLIRWKVLGVFLVPGVLFIDNPTVQASAWVRVLTAIMLLGKGLGLQVLPWGQSPDYSFNGLRLVESLLDLRFLFSFFALLAVSAAAWFYGRKNRLFPLTWGWYLLALLPASNLLFPVGTIFGERLLYLSSAGFCLVIGFLLSRLPKHSGWLVGAVVGLVLSFQTFSYSRVWADGISLYSAAIASVPGSVKSQFNLGAAYRDAGRLDAAEVHWNEALRIYPDHVETLSDLGSLWLIRGDYTKSMSYLKHATEVAPERASAWYNLGLLYKKTGDFARSREAFERFVALGENEFPEEVRAIRESL